MRTYLIRRLLLLIPTLFILTIIVFLSVRFIPGDVIDAIAAQYEEMGFFDEADRELLERMLGLDVPVHVQYGRWIGVLPTPHWLTGESRYNGILQGTLGQSLMGGGYNIEERILDRLPVTVELGVLAIIIGLLIALPIGIYSALRQYSVGDYMTTIIGFVGLALPNFLLALALTYLVFAKTGHAVTGLFSIEYKDAPWTIAKLIDLLGNIWLPILVIASAGTASLVRILRATLLDEKNKQYVTTARAKGLPEHKLILKYPVRVAINPLISTIGWTLPMIVSGEIIVSQTLGLETLGPVLLSAAMGEDMFLVGSIVMILSSLTVIGTLISDILLAWIDPRIRFDKVSI